MKNCIFYQLKKIQNEEELVCSIYKAALGEKVAAMLTKKKIESYCPLNSTIRQGAGQKKLVYDPLFTSFVFVQIEDVELIKVKEVDGVINFIWPAPCLIVLLRGQ